LRGIAQQCVREILLGLERRVGLGAVVGESVDAVAGGSKGRVGVAEEADLVGACD
jgi:ABC-type taurine transport system ATPase subunit